MPISKLVTQHRTIAYLKVLELGPVHRPAMKKIFLSYVAEVHAAEKVFDETTEEERKLADAAKTAADAVFQQTVNSAEAKCENTLATLPEEDKVTRNKVTADFHAVLRDANQVYDKAVGPTTIVLRAIEARAMKVFEASARTAFKNFEIAVTNLVGTADTRSSSHAGSDRLVLKEAGRKR